VGQTSTEAKREVEQTRAHLGETIEALQLRARRNLDVKTQLQENRAIQMVLGGVLLAIVGLAVVGVRARRKRSTAEQLVRKLKLNELRTRLEDFRDDAKAWATAQRRIVKADGKNVEVQTKEGIARRLLVSAAEAALVALASGYARRMVSGASTPHERGHAAVSKKR
jgi:Protein of unknown function (DUF3618)